jgi:hypothetical protein
MMIPFIGNCKSNGREDIAMALQVTSKVTSVSNPWHVLLKDFIALGIGLLQLQSLLLKTLKQ